MEALFCRGTYIHYRAERAGDHLPTLVFINSLGTDYRIWNGIADVLRGTCNMVFHDKRGHGLSEYRAIGPSIATYSEDVEALASHFHLSRITLCGVSVGGLIAQDLMLRRPDLAGSAILSNSAAKIGNDESWDARIRAIEKDGIAGISEAILERWFSATFRRTREAELAVYRNMLVRTPVDGYLDCCKAIKAADYTSQVKSIAAPVLVIGGEMDGSTPPETVQQFASTIAGSRLHIFPDVGHLPCIERPSEMAKIIAGFMGLKP